MSAGTASTNPLSRAIHYAKVAAYLARGRRPWSHGYYAYRTEFLRKALANKELRESFRFGHPLPAGYAQRLDARMIEIPWVVARLSDSRVTMLDAGSSLNHRVVLETGTMTSKDLTIVTLAPEAECFWYRNISYVFGDLRSLVFRDDAFDVVACISTIEHVGMNNALYTGNEADRVKDRGSFISAVAELRRVLKPGGTLFVSMPFGRYEDHGWFQQFDTQKLNHLIEAVGPATLSERIYRYLPTGWHLSEREACRDSSFFDIHEHGKNGHVAWPDDMPAGERAVACLEFHTTT